MKRSFCIGLIAGLVLMLAGTVYASQETQTMNVTANAQGSVSIQAITDIDFGSFNAASPPPQVFGTGSITISDPSSSGYDIAIGEGKNYGPVRNLSDGNGNLMPYFLYQDPGYNTEWGTAGGTYDPVDNSYPNGSVLTGNGDNTFTVYGFVDGLAGPFAPGAYTDSVDVTLMY